VGVEKTPDEPARSCGPIAGRSPTSTVGLVSMWHTMTLKTSLIGPPVTAVLKLFSNGYRSLESSETAAAAAIALEAWIYDNRP
jgi:hypothetical protein